MPTVQGKYFDDRVKRSVRVPRNIIDHWDGHGLAEKLIITADDMDMKNGGGASHHYDIHYQGSHLKSDNKVVGFLQYQHGPRDEAGSTPGLLDSCLLAIVIDRMRCFNAGPFSTRENALVMTHAQEALHWLKHRADERAIRGVLGQNIK